MKLYVMAVPVRVGQPLWGFVAGVEGWHCEHTILCASRLPCGWIW